MRPRLISPRGPRHAAALVLLGGLALAAAPAAGDPGAAAALRARYASLAPQLARSPFGARLHLQSDESPHAIAGDVYAVVDYPVASVAREFAAASNWCEALILHLNVKYCHPVARDGRTVLSVAIGRKYDQPLSDAYRVEFGTRPASSERDYFSVELGAPRGPLGTTNYEITLEAVALDAAQTLLHLRYSYQYGLQAKLAIETYLASTGSGKVGFTRVEAPGDREPRYIGGLRGTVERNAMRYYLAVDACLAVGGPPSPERLEARLQRWFAGTERYARQLHEVDREIYFDMKHREYARQQTQQ
jgi:hypothetical protein